MSTRPLAPFDDALRAELLRLREEVERACPPYRASRRAVALPAAGPRALRWYWELFGHSALSQHCVAPDDPAARATALDTLDEWCQRDARYDALRPRVAEDFEVIAFDDDELLLLARDEDHDDPPLTRLRGPMEATAAPALEPGADSLMQYLARGVLRGLWSELVRVLLTARPPIALERPFPRIAGHVGRGSLAGIPVWVVERTVGDRPGFAVYCQPHEAEVLDAWLIEQGLGDDMLL